MKPSSHSWRQGRHVAEFAIEVGVSRAFIYRLWQLGDPAGPRCALVGRRRIVIETPEAWLERLSTAQVAP